MRQPNILFILIDDMGQRDLGCYGSTFYETPNIDSLARDGMLFTDAYAACPVCSPTRASILTGRYPATLGLTDYIDWSGTNHPRKGRLIDVPYVKNLPNGIPNTARELRSRGYETWHVGKWHLGYEESWPEKHGFDVNIAGFTHGMPVNGYFSPWGFPNLADGPDGEYLTDRLTDEAIALIRGRDRERPFFLNMWYYSVHTPIQAKEEIIAKYRQKAKRLGLDEQTAIVEGARFPGEHKKDQRIQRRVIQSDPVYAAMIETLDTNIGRLFDTLATEGLADDTMVVFTSDNGGLATAEGSPTSNLPLAEGKGWMYEGGTREPLLVRWPGRVAPGGECAQVVTSVDFLPTLVDAAEGGQGAASARIDGVEGESIVPILTGARSALVRDAI